MCFSTSAKGQVHRLSTETISGWWRSASEEGGHDRGLEEGRVRREGQRKGWRERETEGGRKSYGESASGEEHEKAIEQGWGGCK